MLQFGKIIIGQRNVTKAFFTCMTLSVIICGVNAASLTIFIQFFSWASVPMLTNHKEGRYYCSELQKSIVHIFDLWPAENLEPLARFAPPSLSVTDRSALLREGRIIAVVTMTPASLRSAGRRRPASKQVSLSQKHTMADINEAMIRTGLCNQKWRSLAFDHIL